MSVTFEHVNPGMHQCLPSSSHLKMNDDADRRIRCAMAMKNTAAKTVGVCAAQRIVSAYLDLSCQRQFNCRPKYVEQTRASLSQWIIDDEEKHEQQIRRQNSKDRDCVVVGVVVVY